ncbi:DUF5107 domain-containing protein [Paramicrobacterium chengjingii]|uniref:DUF5107 domain-containing protein n=1 Tax=Paramicrobacterium chengjingii TaxID=2769067 RepID=A0ABX6YKD7_9MICO|nr:DUF5107 domain-containing protein [Microbacterium chengjingii]QPZ38807.1 DUF5107 domain-containing protein [Microbacterium chengjingii]
MTDIRVETITLPAADLGSPNPLAVVSDASEPPYAVSGELPEEIAAGMGIGGVRNLFPYTMQDAYERDRVPTEFRSVVLENEHLRVRVMPQLGGRIWSIRDLDRDAMLLHENSAVQYANLALRDAWFAGGIEWNIGTRGHSPSTASPLHAAIVDTADDSILRMWEFDRLRETVFHVDLRLPAGSPVLLAYVRIRNTSGRDVPMYWWTNAAVPQTDQTRIVTPSSTSVATGYDGAISSVEVTDDVLAPARAPYAADYFFDPVPGKRPWVAAADEHGDGLAMLSTDRLQGRKLFCWGEGAGGHRWQRWLTPDGRRYAEIQSGLARTQFEHLVMPAGESWDWVEAYGNIALGSVRGNPDAVAAAARVEQLWPAADADEALAAARALSDVEPGELIASGSGWGALEQARRERCGEPPLADSGTPFIVTTAETRPWLKLLETGALPEASTREIVGSYVRGESWEKLLEAMPRTWQTTMHLGTMAHARGDVERAGAFYAASYALSPSLPALRGRARLRAETGRAARAANDYLSAVTNARPAAQRALTIEAASVLLDAGLPTSALRVIKAAGPEVRELGRVRFLRAKALHLLGRDDEAGRMLREGIDVANLREGDEAVSDLWESVVPSEPLPERYDFRMKA